MYYAPAKSKYHEVEVLGDIDKDIEIIENFLDITEVVLPKYSTAKPKYCVSEEFKISTKNVLQELETYKKIAEKLAEEISNTSCLNVFKDYKEYVLDWARKEVENGKE